MGTKNNPGKFDCYAKAAPDEPMFVLLARDPFAPVVVRLWAFLRRVYINGPQNRPDFELDEHDEKNIEAHAVAAAMEDWRAEHPR